MLKNISFLVILTSLGLSSCRTVRLADVLPETEGTAMGAVSIGKENVDYFVIPEPEGNPLPFEFNTLGDGTVTSASSVVVFKTRERHPVHRTMHTLGGPVRAFDRATSVAMDKAVAMAHSLVNWPTSQQGNGAGLRPPLLPEASESRLQARPLESIQSDPEAPISGEPETIANPAVTTAASTGTQTNRNRG